MSYRLKLSFFCKKSSIVLASFVEQTFLSPLNWLCTFVKSQMPIFMRICFWTLYSIPLAKVNLKGINPPKKKKKKKDKTQAHLVLLHFANIVFFFFTNERFVATLYQGYRHHFPTALAHLCLCVTVWLLLTIFQLLSFQIIFHYHICCGHLWSLMLLL